MALGRRIYELRTAHVPRLTQEALAERAQLSVDLVSTLEQGRKATASLKSLTKIAAALGVPTSALLESGSAPATAPAADDEIAALELSRRVAASDVGSATLGRIETAVDEFARAYPVTKPADLLPRVRTYLGYVVKLVEAKNTLSEHRRLLVAGSWLSLLAATLHIDLRQASAAFARLRTAADLATQTGSTDIIAWCFETRAWASLTDGDYSSARELSQVAQEHAPEGSSIAIQATAQEGRAHARLGNAKETYSALDRVQRMVSPRAKPEHPEHHFTYDPDKATAYFGTTLAWLGDSAAAWSRPTAGGCWRSSAQSSSDSYLKHEVSATPSSRTVCPSRKWDGPSLLARLSGP